MQFRFLAAAMLAFVTTSLHAEKVERNVTSNPTNYCQSALPVFDGVIRKRPLAVVNEGTSSSFITCSYPFQGAQDAIGLNVFFATTNGQPSTFNCTAVTGYGENAAFTTKTVSVPATQQGSLVIRNNSFVNGISGGLLSISCALPPNVGVNDSIIVFLEDIGAITP